MMSLTTLALLPALFAPQPGWQVGHQNRPGLPRRFGQPLHASGELGGHDPVARLPPMFTPPDGRLVAAGRNRAPSCRRGRTTACRAAGRAWPPKIRAKDLGGIEGIPSRSGVYQRFARFGPVEAYVWAFFGRSHPTSKQVAAANADLATVRLRQ
jgi:hypothetical protein